MCIDASPLIGRWSNADAGGTSRESACVYVGSHAGLLRCVDLAGGEVLWSLQLPTRIEASGYYSSTSRLLIKH